MAPHIIASYKLSDQVKLNAQVSRGFRLGGINDPLNVPLCTPQDLVTFGGRETWKDETAWNYEGGIKSRVLDGNAALGVSVFYLDIRDLQATVTAGSCSSRVIFNVPRARSQGIEAEFEAAPNQHFDFAISGSFNDAELRSTLTSTDASGAVAVVSGIEEGRRLPTVPRFQLATAATYEWKVKPEALAYVTGPTSTRGRGTPRWATMSSARWICCPSAPTRLAPPDGQHAHLRSQAARLRHRQSARRRAAQSMGRVGLCQQRDRERALLWFDRERETRARIGFQTNQPRTFSIATRIDF